MITINDERLTEIEISALLSTFMYLDANVMIDWSTAWGNDEPSIYYIVEQLNRLHNSGANPLTSDELHHLDAITPIVQNSPEIFNNIILTSTSNQSFEGYDAFTLEELIGATFIDRRNNDVFVAFRGTGSGKWPANAEGMTSEMSQLQENALVYVQATLNELHSGATNIIGTGHSQGGNLSQFLMLNGIPLSHVYSFSGQGHSEELLTALENRWRRLSALDPTNAASFEEYLSQYTSRMFSINGEADFVHGLGHVIIPQENTFYIAMPDNVSGFAAFHDIVYTLTDTGINWTRDENGNITHGTQHALGRLVTLISEGLINMNPELRVASAFAIMSIAESFMPYNPDNAFFAGQGVHQTGTVGREVPLFATPMQIRLFIAEGLPIIFELLAENPELVREALPYSMLDMPLLQTIAGLDDADIAMFMNMASSIISSAEPGFLTLVLWSALHGADVDRFALFRSSLRYVDYSQALSQHLPELIDFGQRNPRALRDILVAFGVDRSTRILIAQILASAVSTTEAFNELSILRDIGRLAGNILSPSHNRQEAEWLTEDLLSAISTNTNPSQIIRDMERVLASMGGDLSPESRRILHRLFESIGTHEAADNITAAMMGESVLTIGTDALDSELNRMRVYIKERRRAA